MTRHTPIVLDRLSASLERHGVALKRTQLLQCAAAAFGYRNAHEFTAADKAGALAPPAAVPAGRIEVPGVGAMMLVRDPAGGTFAVEEAHFDAQTGAAGDWLVAPMGGLLDAAALRAGDRGDVAATPTAPALEADDCGAVGEEAIRHLAIRSQLNRIIYKVVRGHDMTNMTYSDDRWAPFPLVDLMSNPAPADIGTGELEMVALVDEIETRVREALGLADEPTPVPASVREPREAAAVRTRIERASRFDPAEPVYMTNGCCEAVNVFPEDLDALGLAYGSFDGDFYPLTDEETAFIAEDFVEADDGLHGALTGYAMLYRGAKWLMPTIEIAHAIASDPDFPSRDEVLMEAVLYAGRIQGKMDAIGGEIRIGTDEDDRILVKLLVPIAKVMEAGDRETWNRMLAWLMVDPALPTVLRDEIVHTGREFRVSLSWLGEGEDGDYQPDQPLDRPLVRFDVDRLVDGSWEEQDDGSYCTQVPAYAPRTLLAGLAEHLAETLDAEGGAHPKRLMESMSWMDAATTRRMMDERAERDIADVLAARATYGNRRSGTAIEFGRRADGSVECSVLADGVRVARMQACGGIEEARAWLMTLPCDMENADGPRAPSHALAPQLDARGGTRWMLVSAHEDEAEWFEPGEATPFGRRFTTIGEMVV